MNKSKPNYRGQYFKKILQRGKTRKETAITKWQIDEDGRICKVCHQKKKWKEFSRAKTAIGGHKDICKQCQKGQRTIKNLIF